MGHAGAAEEDGVDRFLVRLDHVGEHFDEAAGGEVGAHVIVAHAGEAGAGEGHAPHRLAIVGEQRSADRAVDGAAALAERPDRRGTAEIEAEALVPGEVVDRARRAVALEIGGGGDDLAVGEADAPRDHARARQGADAEGDVGPVEIEVDDLVRSKAPIVTNQVELHPYLPQAALAAAARAAGIVLTAYYGMADGAVPQDAVLQRIGAKHGKSAAQVGLRWLIQQGHVALSKTARPDRVKENIAIFDFSLAEADMAAIAALARPDGRIVSPAGLAPDWDA